MKKVTLEYSNRGSFLYLQKQPNTASITLSVDCLLNAESAILDMAIGTGPPSAYGLPYIVRL